MELTSPKIIKELCERFDFSFSKGLGQNFLLDKSVLEKICETTKADNVLEVGPGFGVLTYELAKNGKNVVSLEIDKRLQPVLEYTLSEFDNTKIIWGDVLKLDVKKIIKEEFGNEKVSLTANLPYYITTPIVAKMLESGFGFENIVVMVQKEVAQRFCAKAGSKDYGAISVMCQYYAHPSIVATVSAGSFMPPPKVDSAVVNFEVYKEPKIKVKDEKLYFRVVKAAFGQRRKTLVNCLANGLGVDKTDACEILKICGLSENIRGEKLTLEEFAKITDLLLALKGEENESN